MVLQIKGIGKRVLLKKLFTTQRLNRAKKFEIYTIDSIADDVEKVPMESFISLVYFICTWVYSFYWR